MRKKGELFYIEFLFAEFDNNIIAFSSFYFVQLKKIYKMLWPPILPSTISKMGRERLTQSQQLVSKT